MNRPLVLKNKGGDLHLIAIFLLVLAIVVALRPILMKSSHPAAFYYPLYGSLFAIFLVCLTYLFAPNRNKTIFRIDENGMFFHYCFQKQSLSFEWSELKQITARWCYNERGFKERGLCIVTQDDAVYEFCVFKYFAFGRMAIPRLKKAVDYYSKGSVPFKSGKLSGFYMNK